MAHRAPIKGGRRQPTDEGKYLQTPHITGDLSLTIYKGYLELTSKRQPNLKMGKWPNANTYFSKEDAQVASKHRRCPASLAIRETQIKTMMSDPFTCTRKALIKTDHNKSWQGETGALTHCWSECKGVWPLRKIARALPRKVKHSHLRTQQFYSKLYIQEKWKVSPQSS